LFQEPFGLVNAEAMACGTAVVGSNRGGIPEVLGDAGVLIDPENLDEYARALCEMLRNPARRSQLGRASVERVHALFDWRVVAENWMEFVKDVCLDRITA
jgi:glycosyltransferase involved in cell wall biosynthesis